MAKGAATMEDHNTHGAPLPQEEIDNKRKTGYRQKVLRTYRGN